jgi:hypothetical protein
MTIAEAAAMKPQMGRKLLWPERIAAKFADGTLARIANVLRAKEARLSFIREAVEREIERREHQSGHKPKRKRTNPK